MGARTARTSSSRIGQRLCVLPQLYLKRFYATEAALSLSVLAYNLCVLFQRHVGWEDRVTTATLRMRLFTTGGIVSRTGGYLTLRLAVREGPPTGLVAEAIREAELPCGPTALQLNPYHQSHPLSRFPKSLPDQISNPTA